METAAGASLPAAGGGHPLHVAIFPFMSKGHTIPLIQLARLLHRRRLAAAVTFFTTPLNAPFIRSSLDDLPRGAPVAVLELPFPRDAPGVPPGVESTDQLPSMSDFPGFLKATGLLRPDFQRGLAGLHPPADLLVSDEFLGWTLEPAKALGIPRLGFTGMSWYAMSISVLLDAAAAGAPFPAAGDDDRSLQLPGFERIRLTRSDLRPMYVDPDGHCPEKDFRLEMRKTMAGSRGFIVNSFLEMESAFADCWNGRFPTISGWTVGPLCLVQPEARPSLSLPAEYAIKWLDDRLAEGRPLLYVSFGTQAELSRQQLEELVAALENSRLDFLWVLGRRQIKAAAAAAEEDHPAFKTFEERVSVSGRGLVIRDSWMPQTEILSHAAVGAFLSHCGWNSVLESICAGVPILAMPMMAEQHLNAKMVVEELGIGLRLPTEDGTWDGLVRRGCIEERARALLVGEEGREAAAKVGELAVAARESMEEEGSSWRALAQMLEEARREPAGADPPGDRNGQARPPPGDVGAAGSD